MVGVIGKRSHNTESNVVENDRSNKRARVTTPYADENRAPSSPMSASKTRCRRTPMSKMSGGSYSSSINRRRTRLLRSRRTPVPTPRLEDPRTPNPCILSSPFAGSSPAFTFSTPLAAPPSSGGAPTSGASKKDGTKATDGIESKVQSLCVNEAIGHTFGHNNRSVLDTSAPVASEASSAAPIGFGTGFGGFTSFAEAANQRKEHALAASPLFGAQRTDSRNTLIKTPTRFPRQLEQEVDQADDDDGDSHTPTVASVEDVDSADDADVEGEDNEDEDERNTPGEEADIIDEGAEPVFLFGNRDRLNGAPDHDQAGHEQGSAQEVNYNEEEDDHDDYAETRTCREEEDVFAASSGDVHCAEVNHINQQGQRQQNRGGSKQKGSLKGNTRQFPVQSRQLHELEPNSPYRPQASFAPSPAQSSFALRATAGFASSPMPSSRSNRLAAAEAAAAAVVSNQSVNGPKRERRIGGSHGESKLGDNRNKSHSEHNKVSDSNDHNPEEVAEDETTIRRVAPPRASMRRRARLSGRGSVRSVGRVSQSAGSSGYGSDGRQNQQVKTLPTRAALEMTATETISYVSVQRKTFQFDSGFRVSITDVSATRAGDLGVDEYHCDYWERLVQKEEQYWRHGRSELRVRHPHLKNHMRTILVNWLSTASEELRLNYSTFFRAICILDQYLSVTKNVNMDSLQGWGIAALYLAIQFEESECNEATEWFFKMEHDVTGFKTQPRVRELSETLQYALSPPDIFAFFTLFFKTLSAERPHELGCNELLQCLFFLELVQLHSSLMNRYRPSVVAACALALLNPCGAVFQHSSSTQIPRMPRNSNYGQLTIFELCTGFVFSDELIQGCIVEMHEWAADVWDTCLPHIGNPRIMVSKSTGELGISFPRTSLPQELADDVREQPSTERKARLPPKVHHEQFYAMTEERRALSIAN